MMKYLKIILCICCFNLVAGVNAQNILPGITVKNFSGKIVVSWQNVYTATVSNIFIQRSYDSLKNYTTIGTVLNPQNRENGYSDVNPPYTKMYYRVSVSFEGGAYVVSLPQKPVRAGDVANNSEAESRYFWQANAVKDSGILTAPKKENEITYPSEHIYTSKDNNIVIHLADAATKKYSAKFFNEADSLLFELTKLNDEYLILEKVNFVHTGWFHFEIYESGKLLEKNKFQILSKEQKAGNK